MTNNLKFPSENNEPLLKAHRQANNRAQTLLPKRSSRCSAEQWASPEATADIAPVGAASTLAAKPSRQVLCTCCALRVTKLSLTRVAKKTLTDGGSKAPPRALTGSQKACKSQRMTVNDPLFDAIEQIQTHLSERFICRDAPELKKDVQWLLERMIELQSYLDDPTGSRARPSFSERFKNSALEPVR